MINEILLRRKNKLTVHKKISFEEIIPTDEQKRMVMTILKNVQSLGYTFDKEVISNLIEYNAEELEQFYNELIPMLKTLVGADVKYKPMYPNFPKQVLEMDEFELYFNAIIHYLTDGKLIPEYKVDERFPLFDDVKYTVLSVGDSEDLKAIFKNLLGSKTSISEQDKDDIDNIVKNSIHVLSEWLPNEIPFKENLVFFTRLLMEDEKFSPYSVYPYFKTATDVLRLIVSMSDGDITLATPTKFKSMKRIDRRFIMMLLSQVKSNLLEDMYAYQNEWIRVGEKLHPTEFMKLKLPSLNVVINAFDSIRNKKKPMFFAGQVQSLINDKEMLGAATKLKARPGEFARKLDKLVRDASHPEMVIDEFARVADEVATPVLLQLIEHFRYRNQEEMKVIFPKGQVAKVHTIENTTPHIYDAGCARIVDICQTALINRFAKKEKLGNVYIDPEMKQFIVPFNQRSASNSKKIVVRGSRFGVDKNTKVVRPFIWWTNNKNGYGIDVDLGCSFYDKNWNYCSCITYYDLKNIELGACHSGDIINGGNVDGDGASEFIDIDIDKLKQHDIRYVVFQVHNYSDVNFVNMQNCRFGFMERQSMNSGEIFEPKTVKNIIDLSAQATQEIPMVFDVDNREFVWCDIVGAGRTDHGGNNIASNIKGTTASCYAIVNMHKTNLYDLILLNAMGRGTIVDSREEADIIFSNDTTIPTVEVEVCHVKEDGSREIVVETIEKPDVKIVTAYDVDYFMSEMM